MSKRFKWVIGITALGMALVLVASGWHFYHLVRFAKESQETIYEKIIEEADKAPAKKKPARKKSTK